MESEILGVNASTVVMLSLFYFNQRKTISQRATLRYTFFKILPELSINTPFWFFKPTYVSAWEYFIFNVESLLQRPQFFQSTLTLISLKTKWFQGRLEWIIFRYIIRVLKRTISKEFWTETWFRSRMPLTQSDFNRLCVNIITKLPIQDFQQISTCKVCDPHMITTKFLIKFPWKSEKLLWTSEVEIQNDFGAFLEGWFSTSTFEWEIKNHFADQA